jgi:hypothetical protein
MNGSMLEVTEGLAVLLLLHQVRGLKNKIGQQVG